ncbi:uncharacterized protein [Chironomus tepperi]|uniref:uncharacterized protein isoform X2 n=1 Tax=Chironomus tepperi TaxID=113505 RepID=UPI00391F71FB
MKFFLFLLFAITVTSSKGEDIRDELNELRSKIQDEQNEISEVLLNTIKDVTEVSSMNVNNDPIITPAMNELNNYLGVMKSSVDESSLITTLMDETTTMAPVNITSNSSNCVQPFIIQSIQNVGEAQQLVSNILSNVSSTLSTVSSNFNGLANLNSTGNGTNVVNTIFSAVSAILHSVVQFTNEQITQVNNRIENDFNTFSQIAYNMTACQPSTSNETATVSSNESSTVSSNNDASANEIPINESESASTDIDTDKATTEKTSESSTSEGLTKGLRHADILQNMDDDDDF